MIQAAEKKRCVAYVELENCFGLNHDYVGFYAGRLDEYCIENKFPALSGLIISSTLCQPSHGFDWYQEKYKKSWGEIISECWKRFHVTSSREKQSKNFSGLNGKIIKFVDNC
jgi:hypothetical protein